MRESRTVFFATSLKTKRKENHNFAPLGYNTTTDTVTPFASLEPTDRDR